jgi:predicted acetyltransferase
MLIQWGVGISRREGWPITVFAGPTACSLYRKFGFKTAGTVITTVVGEEERIEFPAMALDPNNETSMGDIDLEPRRLFVAYNP